VRTLLTLLLLSASSLFTTAVVVRLLRAARMVDHQRVQSAEGQDLGDVLLDRRIRDFRVYDPYLLGKQRDGLKVLRDRFAIV
jgi:hypothetical protein